MADDRIKILAPPKAAHRLGTDLTRRRLLSMGAAGLAGLVVAPGVLAACGGDDSGSSAGGTGGGGSGGGGNHTLNLFTWAEYHSQELLDKFGKVSVTVYNSNEEAIAKLAGLGWHERLRPHRADRRLHPPDGGRQPHPEAGQDAAHEVRERRSHLPRPDVGPRQQLHDSEGLGLDGLDLRQHRHHHPAEDVERLPRRGDGSGERAGVGARHPRQPHRSLLLGQRHRLDHN